MDLLENGSHKSPILYTTMLSGWNQSLESSLALQLMFMFEPHLTSWESRLVAFLWLTRGSLRLGTLRWHKGRQGESGEEILSLMPNQPPFVQWNHQQGLLLLTYGMSLRCNWTCWTHSLHWFFVRLLLGVQFLLHGHPTRPKASKWPLCRKTKFPTEHTSPSS